ncbi:hypothetical protein [Natranaerobius thermophilus]|uniref:FAD/FMN-containing dehydrogenase n=1 Tax=Natranaerobius thermophilus (strain ATCC BAA-1301 / DSM 18059 / JW/NM-WN-LF) TaxID=457570 RepID=B2A0J6_NATTJ|nr:hypothetical protein [Natranaerobius thermophilus]ACB84557.1 hypothetical protein Nther_0973 [Natranaerobius thermophilus JW/NM-WN-LF]
MDKKIIGVVLAVVIVFTTGTVVMGQGVNSNDISQGFRRMMPFMQEHHPELSESELKEMYEYCHGTN